MQGHVLAEAVARPKAKRLVGVQGIAGISRIGAQPPLRDELVRVLEVCFGAIRRPLVHGYLCVGGNPSAEDGLSAGTDEAGAADGHGRIYAEAFLNACGHQMTTLVNLLTSRLPIGKKQQRTSIRVFQTGKTVKRNIGLVGECAANLFGQSLERLGVLEKVVYGAAEKSGWTKRSAHMHSI